MLLLLIITRLLVVITIDMDTGMENLIGSFLVEVLIFITILHLVQTTMGSGCLILKISGTNYYQGVVGLLEVGILNLILGIILN